MRSDRVSACSWGYGCFSVASEYACVMGPCQRYIGAEHFVRRDIRLHGRAVSLDTEIVRYAW